MSKPLRTFIAVAVPTSPELRRVIADLDSMGSALKAVSAEHLHITLKFLGDTPPEQVPAITAILKEVVAEFSPFAFELIGLGAFPRVERPTVIWAGVDGGEPLVALSDKLEDRLMDLGYEPETRTFTPHLTLARVRRKPPDDLFDLFTRHESTRFATVPVNALTFYESQLTPDGPTYTSLAVVALG